MIWKLCPAFQTEFRLSAHAAHRGHRPYPGNGQQIEKVVILVDWRIVVRHSEGPP